MKHTKNPRLRLMGVALLLPLGLWTAAAAPTHQLLLDASDHPTDNVDLADSHWTGTLDAARLPGVPFSLLTSRPTTLGGYGVTDAATAAQGALAATALQPAGNGSSLTAATNRDVSNLTNSGYNVVCFGDSLTAGVGATGGQTYPVQLAAVTGNRHVDNFGVGGLTAAQILAQEVQAHPDKLQGCAIIWAGRNDIGVNPNTTVLANIASMVALLPAPKNYVVLSVVTNAGETSGTSGYNTITSLNASLASAYGSHYLDVRGYLVSQYNPASSADVTAHTGDTVPPSLQSDGLHLNNAGYLAVATFLANNASAWGGAQSLATNVGVGAILANGPQVGSVGAPFYGFASFIGAGFPTNSGFVYPSAPLQAVVSGSATNGLLLSSASVGNVGLAFSYNAGGVSPPAPYAAIYAEPASSANNIHFQVSASGALVDQMLIRGSAGGTVFNGPDANGNVILGTGNLALASPSGSYPSTVTMESTAWNGGDGEGAGLAFVGTKSGAVNGVLAGFRFYGASNAWAWKVGGALSTGGTVDATAQMKIDATGLSLGGVETLAPQSSAPATPASGVTLYVDSSGNLHALHSTGTNHILSAP